MAPAYGLAEEVKRALYADAVRLCRHVGYKNAGTVEFMVDKDGKHYFLEVNPRVQVGWRAWEGCVAGGRGCGAGREAPGAWCGAGGGTGCCPSWGRRRCA
jgi:hypothetical protein